MLYILVSIFFNVLGQFFIKIGVGKISPLSISVHNIVPDIAHIVFYPQIFTGLFLYAVGSIFWIFALSKTELSVAYPMLSLGYVFVLILSALVLKENISVIKILGVCVIIFGIFLISRSA